MSQHARIVVFSAMATLQPESREKKAEEKKIGKRAAQLTACRSKSPPERLCFLPAAKEYANVSPVLLYLITSSIATDSCCIVLCTTLRVIPFLHNSSSDNSRSFLHIMPPFSEAARIQFEIEWVRNRNRKKRIRVTYEKAQKIKVGFLTYADLDVNTCWIGHFECSYI
jgi:hypothetical protein